KTAIQALGTVSLPVKTAGDSGKLFGSVTPGDIVTAIKKAGGPNLDKRVVRLPKGHIKAVGSHPVALHVHPEVDVEVELDVVAEGYDSTPTPVLACAAATGDFVMLH